MILALTLMKVVLISNHPSTFILVAAIAADLPPYHMSLLEKRELPQFAKNPGAYLQVRNHILGLWQNDLHSYLTPKQAEKNIQVTIGLFDIG
jgi:hypothetical protein